MKIFYLLTIGLLLGSSCHAGQDLKSKQLKAIYRIQCKIPSDIHEHLPDLKQLASECSSAVEIGVRSMVSTWAILQGLSESEQPETTYIGIDLAPPLQIVLMKAQSLAHSQGIDFHFWQGNDMDLDIPTVDLLFIDSLHTYCHLTYELEKFSSRVTKYIALHDTSAPWGEVDDTEYKGDYSEYAPWIDRSKKGLWPATVDFLQRHPEWSLYKRKTNNHGFTILKRVS
ncbi:MAG TPA: hypothetical protein DCE71_08880 [Parachlamydiales bacterium]|nr:hypothetical protein [Parachlamydiales bacterium]